MRYKIVMKIKYIQSPDKREKFQRYGEFIKENFPQFLECEDPDLILTAGGDGTMLSVIQEWRDLGVPFLGRGLGSLNFLMNEFSGSDSEAFQSDLKILQAIENGESEIKTQKTSLISVGCCNAEGEENLLGEAVNDVVIGTDIMGYHHFNLNSEDSTFREFDVKGTGICVSTPIGSTGYNFNNAGKVLPLNSEDWSVTGVVCNRPLSEVLREQKLEISILGERGDDFVQIYIDGLTKKLELSVGSGVTLEPGSEIELAFLDRDKFMRKRADIIS